MLFRIPPGLDRVLGNPDRQAPALDQGVGIRLPVADALAGFGGLGDGGDGTAAGASGGAAGGGAGAAGVTVARGRLVRGGRCWARTSLRTASAAAWAANAALASSVMIPSASRLAMIASRDFRSAIPAPF